MERYFEMSEKVLAIFRELCPEVTRISIDEAFLDMSGTERLWGSPRDAAGLLKTMVRERTGLTVSAGVASNRYVAKIASGLEKPDGLVLVESGDEANFMLTLPLSRLWGAGERTQERFRDLGILAMDELVAKSEEELMRHFGAAGGHFLHAACRGADLPIFEGRTSSRSISTETTFERDIVDRDALEASLLEMSCTIIFRLRREGGLARILALKLRLADFSTSSRRQAREEPFRTSLEVFEDAKILLDRSWDGRSPVRLAGLGFADLDQGDKPSQAGLFRADDRRQRFESALLDIEDKAGAQMLPARLLGQRSRRPGRPRSEGAQ
jgi:DNA polymerase-4